MKQTIRTARTRVLVCLVAVFSIVAFSGAYASSAQAYTCPSAPSPVWGCPDTYFGFWEYDGIFNWKPGVSVIGDSLITGLQANLANQLTTNGFWGHTYSVPGSAYYHWNNGFNNKEIGQWIAKQGPKHAVVALGTNDAAKLANDPNVTQTEVANNIAWGMERAWQSVPGCVIVVGPSRHNVSPANAQWVRDQMAFRIYTTHDSKPANHRFYWVNWDDISKDHNDWFNGPNDPHMTDAGKTAYANMIVWYSKIVDLYGC